MIETEVQPVTSAEGAAAPVPSAPSNVVVLPSGQRVTLVPKVTVPLGVAAAAVLTNGGSAPVIEAELAQVYLRYAIESWSFRDAKGEIEPITPANIERLIPYGSGGLEVI